MPPHPKKRFFCFVQEKVEGPFELVELAGLLHAKHIDADTPLCAEGSEEWLLFQDRPEYRFAQEIPANVVEKHLQEQAEATASPWTPKKLAMLLWIMAPVFLFLLYRFARMYISYHLAHDDLIDSGIDSSGSN
jgi:hypothetical protein